MIEKLLKSQSRKWLSLLVTVCCLSLLFLNLSSLPVALPTIQAEFHFSNGGIEWVVNAYLLTLTMLILPAGRLSDIYGYRPLFCLGLSFYSLGSLICGFSISIATLLFGRVIQGIGGALMFPPMGAYLISSFPEGQRGKAIGFNVGISSIFLMLGPMIGGSITQFWNWRYLFLLNLPIALFGFVMTLKIVPKLQEKGKKEAFDFKGATLLGSSMGSFTIGLMQGAKWGWLHLYTISFLLSGIFLILLFLKSYKPTHSIIDLTFFKDRRFITSTLCGCLTQLITMVTVFWALYFQKNLGFSPTTAGWLIVLTNFPPIFIAPFGGYLSDFFGVKLPVIIGFCLMIVSLVSLGFIAISDQFMMLFPSLLAFGFGMPLIMSPSYAASMDEIEEEKRAAASSLSLALRQLAPTFGLAIMSAFYFSIIHSEKNGFQAINLLSAGFAVIGIIIALFFLPEKRDAQK